MADHNTLTGAELHEPKGVDAAAANRVYLSNGAGSGSWSLLPAASISGLNNSNLVYIFASIPDVSTASSVFVPNPLAGNIVKIVTVLQGAITVADATLRLRIGGTPVTDSDVTIAFSGSAAGDVDSNDPTAANTVTANSAIEIQNFGTSTTAAGAEVLIAIDVS